jgi:ribose 5-phosphate isomerase B
MRIAVAIDHAGVALRDTVAEAVRAAGHHDHYTAAQCVVHDDCNVLCLGARVIGPAIATELTGAFCAAQFSGEERHVRRLGKILKMERDGMEASP